ncbi:MAG: 50S ribosomal protein L4 [Bdellovibrionales bacterium]|nr:50S ribosomal protein L4 [Bdellovibrionales bacterium]
MTEISLLNTKFEKSGSVKANIDLSVDKINVTVVHQIVKATLAGRRQGTAMTKTKAFVSGGGKKPFKQKGTGNARQGSTRSPLMPGGGTVFGPQPRDYTQKVNKKMMLNAIASVLADKFQAGKLHIVEKIESTGKTKDMFKALDSRKLLPALVITTDLNEKVSQAVGNLERAKYAPVDGFSVYEAIKFENLIIEKGAFEKLISRLV